MSEENVEAARRAFEAFNQRDIDGLLEVAHPDVEFESMLPDSPPYHGHEGVKAWSKRVLTVFPDWQGK